MSVAVPEFAPHPQPSLASRRCRMPLALTAAALLAACGGGGGTEAQTASTQAAAAEPVATSAEAPALGTPGSLDVGTGTLEMRTLAGAAPAADDTGTATTDTLAEHAAATVMEPVKKALAATQQTTGGTGRNWYVDSRTGSDALSGAAATVSGSAGPFKTLGRLMTAAVAAGDTVHLACGSAWGETLRLPADGTSGQRIRVQSLPLACANPPVIDGSLAMLPAQWSRESGSVFKAAFVPVTATSSSVVANGQFASDIAGWTRWAADGGITTTWDGACESGGCLRIGAATAGLVSSPSFPLVGDNGYGTAFMFKAPAGARVRFIVRRAQAPWDGLGFDQTVTATGQWQTIHSSFRATASVAAARFDIETSATASPLQFDGLRIVAPSAQTPKPLALVHPTAVLNVAHHPNRGHDSAQPRSPYARIAANSDSAPVGGLPRSTYLTTGADLRLPAGVTIASGTKLRVRTYAWFMDELAVASVQGQRLLFAQPSRYPLTAGWGYYLYGERWMLDAPGEWHHDAARGLILAWMPDSNAPAATLSAPWLDVGIDLNNRQHVTVDGVKVRAVGTGVAMRRSTAVALANMTIEDTAGAGVDAGVSTDAAVTNSVLQRTGRDAIAGSDLSAGHSVRGGFSGNRITESGVRVVAGAVASLPVPAFASILAGDGATVSDNDIQHSAYIGIRGLLRTTIQRNWVSQSCLVLDDCGAIYTMDRGNNGVIRDNLVVGAIGNTDGKPASQNYTQAQGIMLDELADGVTVTGNTVSGADNGVHVHVSNNNTISRNKLYGNRQAQVWLQDATTRTAATGDVYRNTVTSNQFVPIADAALAFAHTTPLGSAALFGSYDGNRYFDRILPDIGRETLGSNGTSFTITTWRQARAMEPTGSGVSQERFAPALVTSATVVPNGNVATGIGTWTVWNQSAPYGALTRIACGSAWCLRYVAGASEGLVSSQNFSVVKDQWYRVSVDMAVTGGPVGLLVRRGGGGSNGYESLMAQPTVQFAANGTLTRHSFWFKATKTVNAADAATGDLGARVDFVGLRPGMTLTVTNLEMVRLATVNAGVRSDLLVNATQNPADMACPVAATEPAKCALYARLSDSSPVTWPLRLPARSSEVLYTLDRSLLDGDGDGIADSQDRCPATATGLAANAAGCAIGQTPS